MFQFIKKIATLIILSLLLSCATPEYLQANHECQMQADKMYPPALKQQTVKKSRLITVPDGSQTCDTRYDATGGTVTAKTRCTQGERTEIQYYNDVETIDLNYEARSGYVNNCRPNLCIQRYGNRDCEIPKPLTEKPAESPQPQKNGTVYQNSELQSAEGITAAKNVLIVYFGYAWVNNPTGRYVQGFGSLCGDNGRGLLPFSDINTIRFHKFSNVIQVGKINWLKIMIPCTLIEHEIKGSYIDRDVEEIKNALKYLGAKI